MSAKRQKCDVTIAICTYNRLQTLRNTLNSLNYLRGNFAFEVVVVNGPSNDGTGQFLESRNDVRVFSNPETNLSISRNIAIANAVGEFIAFIDDDAVPEPDWMLKVLEKFRQTPDVAAIGGFIRDADGVEFQAKYVFADALGNSFGCENSEYASLISKGAKVYPSLTGTNVIFRRESLLEVGGFDEVFAYFLDETDVNKRMHDRGMRSLVVPEAEIHHKYAPSHLRTEKNVSKNMYPIARSIAYFALAHGVPERGFGEAADRIKSFYKDEYRWKSDMLLHDTIDVHKFNELLFQTRRGIFDAIEIYFSCEQSPERLATRVKKHFVNSPAVIRRAVEADSNIRVCLFSQDHGRERHGGIGRWTNLVARGLAQLGHEVSVIGESDVNKSYCDFTKDGFWSHNIRITDVSHKEEVDCLGLPGYLANASMNRLYEFRRIMPRRQFQIASTPIWDVEGAAVIGSRDVPVVLSLHTCAGLMLKSKPEWQADKNYYDNHVLKTMSAELLALKRCNIILANSKAIMQDISQLYEIDLFAQRHAIVPHGVEDIGAPDSILEYRTGQESPLRIVFVGRLENRKGVKDMVQVLKEVLGKKQDALVDIVGEKVDDQNMALVNGLIRQYPNRVVYHGFMSAVELDLLMRKADILFTPSTYESFGLVFVEAMRYSIPSVAYAVGGVPEVVTNGIDGLLAPLDDVSMLTKNLLSLMENRELRIKMSQSARESFVNRFDYRLMARSIEAVYREAMKPGRPKTAN